MRTSYSVLPSKPTENDVLRWIADVTRDRANDLSDYETQQATKTSIYPVPSSMTDLIGTEKAGDIAVNTTHLYIVTDNAGTLEWRRAALSTF
jgi:hypothetical protein